VATRRPGPAGRTARVGAPGGRVNWRGGARLRFGNGDGAASAGGLPARAEAVSRDFMDLNKWWICQFTSRRDRSPTPTRGNNLSGRPVADGLSVAVCPPHGDLSWPWQTPRCRLSTRDAGRRWRPVELVGNLKGFPQIHRPAVVLVPARGGPLAAGAKDRSLAAWILRAPTAARRARCVSGLDDLRGVGRSRPPPCPSPRRRWTRPGPWRWRAGGRDDPARPSENGFVFIDISTRACGSTAAQVRCALRAGSRRRQCAAPP